MKEVGTSSLWVERYRPKNIEDLILPQSYKDLFKSIISSKEMPNLLFFGNAGLGKTSLAFTLVNELGADVLYINGSLENSIDTVRYKVLQFATSCSLMDNKKIVIIDEMDRMVASQEALKVVCEQTEANCRFIFTTNNIGKIIDPIKSRTQLIDFSFVKTNAKEVITQYFKRCQFILKSEGIEFDKAVLAEFIQKAFPDFRKTLNELQKAATMYGTIDASIFKSLDDALVVDLIKELKAKKFANVQKLSSQADPDQFYTEFYAQCGEYLQPQSIPDVILLLAQYGFQNNNCIDKNLNLFACLVEIMGKAVWK